MGPVSGVAVYFVIWWLCLFIILPFGVRSQHETGEVAAGTERGAPDRPRLLARVIATTILAAIVFGGFFLYFNVFKMGLEDLMW